jgi:hypothetical protein
MNPFLNIFLRIVAVFAATGLSVIGMGSVVGIGVIQSMMLAGGLGVATVIEALARGFLDDGRLSQIEINQAFAQVDKKNKKEG